METSFHSACLQEPFLTSREIPASVAWSVWTALVVNRGSLAHMSAGRMKTEMLGRVGLCCAITHHLLLVLYPLSDALKCFLHSFNYFLYISLHMYIFIKLICSLKGEMEDKPGKIIKLIKCIG